MKQKERLKSIDNEMRHTNIFLVIGFLVLLVFPMVSCSKLNILINSNKVVETSAFVDKGCIQRIGVDSVMLNNKVYSGICNSDLELLQLNDMVIVEDSVKLDGWWNSCDDYRVTIQKAQLKNSNCLAVCPKGELN